MSRGSSTDAGTVEVLVAIPTFRRPDDLRELLPLVLEQTAEVGRRGGFRVATLVVDNDPDRSGQPAVEAFGADVRYAHEPQPGIAAVRDRALDESTDHRLLVMMDDDERPHPGWLSSLLDTWTGTGAALVAGRVVADYDGELDPWIRAGDFFVRRNMATGKPITAAAAGNVLLDLDQIRPLGLRFERRLGLTGGEDTLFTRRLAAAGASMVWCAESVITDRVPAARMSRRWVLVRAWSHGNTTALIDIELTPPGTARSLRRGRLVAGGLVRVVVGLGRALAGLVLRRPRDQARGLRMAMRGGGMVLGALGHAYQEYRRPAAPAPSGPGSP